MANDPMDMVIGVDDASKRDSATAGKHVSAGVKAAKDGDRTAAILEFKRAAMATLTTPRRSSAWRSTWTWWRRGRGAGGARACG